MACDGVWDVMSNYDVVKFVREKLLQGLSTQLVAEQLVFQCYQKGSTDNISAIIVSFLTSEKINIILSTKSFEVKKLHDRILVIRDPMVTDYSKPIQRPPDIKRTGFRNSRMLSLLDELPNLNPTPVMYQIDDIQNLLEPVLPPAIEIRNTESIPIEENSLRNKQRISHSGRILMAMSSPQVARSTAVSMLTKKGEDEV